MQPSTASLPPSTTFAPSRSFVLAYGLGCYAIGMAGLTWLILAALDLVPFTGAGIEIPSTTGAILFSASFLLLFGVQHGIMARPWFKERWTKIIPPAMERPTFVLLSGLIMASAMAFWQPLPNVIWSVDGTLAIVVRSIGVLGWLYLLSSSFAIDHFELFGLKQVWHHFKGTEAPKPKMVQRFTYRFDRHPLMSGIFVGLWFTPVMTLDHLVLASACTLFMMIGVAIEERTLIQMHGESYREYRRTVPALVPLPGRWG